MTHSLEASIENLDTSLFLNKETYEYWVIVPRQDLEAVVEFAKIKFREEDR